MPITKERAERIAKSHACPSCGEYSFKKLQLKPASDRLRAELDVAWQAAKTCGVCGAVTDMGIDEDGDVVYGG